MINIYLYKIYISVNFHQEKQNSAILNWLHFPTNSFEIVCVKQLNVNVSNAKLMQLCIKYKYKLPVVLFSVLFILHHFVFTLFAGSSSSRFSLRRLWVWRWVWHEHSETQRGQSTKIWNMIIKNKPTWNFLYFTGLNWFESFTPDEQESSFNQEHIWIHLRLKSPESNLTWMCFSLNKVW